MSLPGVKIALSNGNLGIAGANAENAIIYAGCSVGGVASTLKYYGDTAALQADLVAGEVLEAAAYGLETSGGTIGVLSMAPTNQGAVGAVTHTGTGSGTVTVTKHPFRQFVVTVGTTGVLGTATATAIVGSGVQSAPFTLPVSNTILIPGTYTYLTFPAHTYTAAETYTVSTLGVITYAANGSGGTDGSVTEAASYPVDWYRPLITVTKAGAIGTAQVTISLDGTAANAGGIIVTPGGGAYAIPDTGIVVTFASTFVVGDTYAFQAAGPTYSNGELVTALTLLETTYINSVYSLIAPIGNLLNAAAWNTQCASLETLGLALFNLGIFCRFINGAPTVGTVHGNGGSLTIDTADTDSVLLTSRLTVSAPHVAACAGDEDLNSIISGLSFRRNCSWGVAARTVGIEASQNPGAVALGGIPGVTAIYRNETSTPGLDAVGFITMRTFPGNVATGGGLSGFFITDAHTMDSTVSDYYPLTNARVIDRACTVSLAAALPLTNSKIPTTTRGNLSGVITETRAQMIDAKITNALTTALVNTSPQDATAAAATCSRTHNILADSNLIVEIKVVPFAYARTITLNIGLAVSA